MKILICEALGHSYGEHRALDACSLALEQGKLHVLLGPSGCGKSTLLEVIAGLQPCTQGRIILRGEEISQQPPQQRRLSMVFQTPACFPHMSVLENILFASPTQDAHARKKAQEIAGMLKIGHLLERCAANLSGGEKQRTAIARALMKEADLILMDEPFSALDAPLAKALGEELRRLQRSLSLSVLYVTHDQQEAMRLADEMFLMQAGKIIQGGVPEQVYADPDNLFAAGFLGSGMNVIPASVKGGQLCFAQMQVPVPFALPQGEVVMAVRGENIRIQREGWPGAQIMDCRRSGALHHIDVIWRGIPLHVLSLTAPCGESICFDLSDCLFFDPHTKRRIRE